MKSVEGDEYNRPSQRIVLDAPYPHDDIRHAVVGAAGSLLAFRSETRMRSGR
jgi:hypothetical protein